MSLRDRFVRNLGIAALVGASTLGLGSPARAQSAFESAGSAPASATAQASEQSTQQTFTYYLPVLANLRGANNSDWRSQVRLRAISGVETHFWIQAHPRGVQAQATDPKSTMYVICGTCSANFSNLLDNLLGQTGQPMHLTGAYWGEVTSNEPLGIDSSTSANFSPDGSNQGGDYATLDASTMWNDPHLARRGDIIEFPLDGTNRTRENLNLFAPPTNTNDYTGPAIQVQATLLDYLGNTIDGTTITLQPGTYTQFAPIAPALTNGKTLNAGDVLQLRLGSDGGNGEFLLYAIKNEIDNVTTTSQDPSNKTGYIRPLITTTFDASMGNEVNDPALFKATFTARPGAYVIDAWFNERGQCDQSGNCTVDYSNTNTQDTNPWAITHNTTLSTPGTFTPLLGIQVRGDDHVIYNRQVTGTPYTVVAEQDYSPANSYATTQSKKDQLAHLIGDNINAVYLGDNTHYGYSDMMNLLTMYTDGIATQANPELDHVQVLDTTNSLMFSMKTGGNAVWGGFTQLQIQQLLNIYGVQR